MNSVRHRAMQFSDERYPSLGEKKRGDKNRIAHSMKFVFYLVGGALVSHINFNKL